MAGCHAGPRSRLVNMLGPVRTDTLNAQLISGFAFPAGNSHSEAVPPPPLGSLDFRRKSTDRKKLDPFPRSDRLAEGVMSRHLLDQLLGTLRGKFLRLALLLLQWRGLHLQKVVHEEIYEAKQAVAQFEESHQRSDLARASLFPVHSLPL